MVGTGSFDYDCLLFAAFIGGNVDFGAAGLARLSVSLSVPLNSGTGVHRSRVPDFIKARP